MAYPKSVIPACLKRESRRVRSWTPDPFDVAQGRGEHSRTTIKTFGGDDLGSSPSDTPLLAAGFFIPSGFDFPYLAAGWFSPAMLLNSASIIESDLAITQL